MKRISDLDCGILGITPNQWEGLIDCHCKKLQAKVKALEGALREIRLNHAQPHRQRQGCRPTTEICDEALPPASEKYDPCTKADEATSKLNAEIDGKLAEEHPLQSLADKMESPDREAEKILEDNLWELTSPSEDKEEV